MFILLYLILICISVYLLKKYIYTFENWNNLTRQQWMGLLLISIPIAWLVVWLWLIMKGVRMLANND